jgi:hypothetical protein
VLGAFGGNSTSSDGSNASVQSTGIDVELGAGNVYVLANAGGIAGTTPPVDKKGGSATIDTGENGAINVTVADGTASSGQVLIVAEGKAGTGTTATSLGTSGGATIVAKGGITLDNTAATTNAGTIGVEALSGQGYIGGDALVDSSGADISVKSNNGYIYVSADGGSVTTAAAGAVGGGATVKAANVSVDLAGTTGMANVSAQGGSIGTGKGPGTGGAATFDATGDVTVTAANTLTTGGPVLVGAQAGRADTGVGGAASFTAKSVTVENSSPKIVGVGSYAGDTEGTGVASTSDKPADATTTVQGAIEVTVDGPGQVNVTAKAGGSNSGGNIGGGKATLTTEGPISVTLGEDATATSYAIVTAEGGTIVDGTDDETAAGDANIIAKGGITVDTSETKVGGDGTTTPTASVSAIAGELASSPTSTTAPVGIGAAASIDSTDADVIVKAGAADANVGVIASNNAGIDAAGYNATLNAKNLSITATKAGAAKVTTKAGDAAGTGKAGGSALVDLTGDLTLTGADNAAGLSELDVIPGAKSDTTAPDSGSDLKVDGETSLTAGKADTASDTGGDVSVKAGDAEFEGNFTATSGSGAGTAGDVSVQTANTKVAKAFRAQAGTGAGAGDVNVNADGNLDVGESATAAAGDGDGDVTVTSTGNVTAGDSLTASTGAGSGDVTVTAAGDVSVENALTTSTGDATSGAGTGEALFSAKNITQAPEVNLYNYTSDPDKLKFAVTDNIDSTKNDTVLNTTGTSAGNVTIGSVDVGDGHKLSINNASGSLAIGALNFAPDQEATLTVQKSDNLALTDLNAKDADVTFELPSGFKKDDTFVSASGTVDLTGSTIRIADEKSDLNVGDPFTLVQADPEKVTFDDTTVITKVGDNIEHVYTVEKGENGIGSTLATVKTSDKSKAYSEGMAAQMAFITTGSDLLADTGTAHAVLAAQSVEGPAVFSAFSFGHSRYETGSHVDVDSFNLIIGASYGFVAGLADITLGAFFEYGNGSYDSHNSFAEYTVNGDGDVDYAGGGILTRFDFAKSDEGSTYAELSARFGRSSNEFSSPDFNPVVRYKFKSSYFGLNFAFGHIFNVNETTSIDLYAKYLWTHQAGADVRLPDDLVVSFNDVNSHRIRGGIRVAIQATEFVKPYFGVAYEYEADGQAKATILGAPIEAPTLKGSTGIGEIGLSVYTGTPVNLDFGIQGYVGRRKGISGSIVLNFEF